MDAWDSGFRPEGPFAKACKSKHCIYAAMRSRFEGQNRWHTQHPLPLLDAQKQVLRLGCTWQHVLGFESRKSWYTQHSPMWLHAGQDNNVRRFWPRRLGFGWALAVPDEIRLWTFLHMA